MRNDRMPQITNYKATDWIHIMVDPLGGSPSWKATPVSNFFGNVPVDVGTDRWLSHDSNTFIGVGVAGGGGLSHVVGTDGWNNSAYGYQALYALTTGYDNAALGWNSLRENTTGYRNTGLGAYSLYHNTTGDHNAASGYAALVNNTTGDRNTASGTYSLYLNTTGYYNTAVGNQALNSNIAGYENTAIGVNANYYNTAGWNNNASGYQALFNNTTGWRNTGCGVYALSGNRTGYENTAVGTYALFAIRPTAKAITAFADYSGTVPGTVSATSATHGLPAGPTDNIGIYGTINYNGVYTVTYIDANSFYFTKPWVATEIGWWGQDLEGRQNTGLGVNAGRTPTTGSTNTFIGHSAGYHASQLTTASNSMALGANTYTTKNNQVIIGDVDVLETILRGSVVGTIIASDAAIPVLDLTQNDLSEGFVDYKGTSAASAVGPISSWTTGNTIQGFVRVEINGAAYWMPYYDAPTS